MEITTNKTEKVFSFNYNLTEEESAILTAEKVKKEAKFEALTSEEKSEVIKRIIANLKSNNEFNKTGKASFFISIYGEEKKEFVKGSIYQLNGQKYTLLEAVQTGSNNKVKLNESTILKLSGTSFKTENGILNAKVFLSLIPVLPKK